MLLPLQLQIRLHMKRQQDEADRERARERILLEHMGKAAMIKAIQRDLDAHRRLKQE